MTAKEYLNQLPEKVAPEALEGKNSVFHFDLTGEGGGQISVLLVDGKLEVKEGFHGDPRCEVKASDENFMGVINKTTNPFMALMTGKVKISNQGELLKYAKIFGIM